MIFIGYSSKDRYTIVESMVFHLKNYGFNVWYDFHDMYLSDARFETNFEHGIKDSKYVIFILSPNFFTSKCAVEELDYAQTLYEQGTIKLFPKKTVFFIAHSQLRLDLFVFIVRE